MNDKRPGVMLGCRQPSRSSKHSYRFYFFFSLKREAAFVLCAVGAFRTDPSRTRTTINCHSREYTVQILYILAHMHNSCKGGRGDVIGLFVVFFYCIFPYK